MQYKRRSSGEHQKPIRERRAFSRHHLELATMLESEGSAQLCWSVDLSCGGMLLQTVEPLRVGQGVTVRFSLPGTLPMEFEASVVRAMGLRAAVQFTDMNAVQGLLLSSSLHDRVNLRVAS